MMCFFPNKSHFFYHLKQLYSYVYIYIETDRTDMPKKNIYNILETNLIFLLHVFNIFSGSAFGYIYFEVPSFKWDSVALESNQYYLLAFLTSNPTALVDITIFQQILRPIDLTVSLLKMAPD